ncbi:energy transducer TonB [Hymenobacter sp. ASUV-10]|uniref:Energy transducer TonB n=1 Tax=Hymenobacter aranciens TaxID=3063996 RepID=A0ABT9BKP8_9BACT|nr:energy transducer TonB [Hymenobacter sp. ASUV-10]MDO7877587.1 energy transducer TonB [Hymenobacter sp. ASUV-10]
MLLLPTFNARLQPCPVSAAAFTPHAGGKFCSQCQRVVQDFSQSINPVADLAAARAAAPDGRVCGSFAVAQVQRPKLTRRLRWFVVALVLVIGQGLTAREALAQVRKPASRSHTVAKPKKQTKQATAPRKAEPVPEPLDEQVTYMGIALPEPTEEVVLAQPSAPSIYTYVEQMPEPLQGGGVAGIAAQLQKNIRVTPADLAQVMGKLFVKFVVTETGAVTDAVILKGCGCGADAAVLQAARSLTGLRPGRQGGQPVKVEIVLPVLLEAR